MNNCENCMYWRCGEGDFTVGAYGECRFNPPVYGSGDPYDEGHFPYTAMVEWCGKWTKNRLMEEIPPKNDHPEVEDGDIVRVN